MTASEIGVALAAAAEAGALLREHFARGVTTEWKGRGDVVTVADREAEAVVRRHVAAAFPDDLVVGEEGEVLDESQVRGRRRWYVDPLDGTTNFVKGQPRWAVAVAFCDARDRMAAAVVHVPLTGEVLAAERGGGARRVAGPGHTGALAVVDVPPEEALALLGPVDGLADAVRVIGASTLSLRVTGSTVHDLSDLAAGRAELFLGAHQGRWDLAAGLLVATEAGAVATDLRGHHVTGPVELAFVATPAVHEALLPRLREVGRAARTPSSAEPRRPHEQEQAMTPDEADAFVAERSRGVVVTLMADGRPQVSNVVYAVLDGRIRISVTDDGAKTRNLRRDPRVSLHVTSDDFWSYVVVEGEAELSPVATNPDDATSAALLRLYQAVRGEPHPDPAEFGRAMVDERRLELSIAVERRYPAT